MNYLSHGYRFVDRPYFLAGTAVPDWLSVVDRKVRVRSKAAAPFQADDDAQLAELARGIMQHHQDDARFHHSRLFTELTLEMTLVVRNALPPDAGFRPSFLGHILIELLLDAYLTEADPGRLTRYYDSFQQLSFGDIERWVGDMARQPAERLSQFIELFVREGFLWDYLSDQRLLYRLNQVMRRVRLEHLPDEFTHTLREIRHEVNRHADDLLAIVEQPEIEQT